MQLDTGWHFHDMHQLLYAFDGAVEIEDTKARYLVPHQFAAMVPAGTAHRTRIQRVSSGSVFLQRDLVETPRTDVSIIRVPPLMREMILESMRWPIMEGYCDPVGVSLFTTFALLGRKWFTHHADLVLPTSTDPGIIRVIDYTLQHLDSVTLTQTCKVAGMSQRTLRRKFVDAVGLTWDDFRLRARIFRAIELLEKEKFPITRIASDVGYSTPSAFTKAFRNLLGESPSAYRRRRFQKS